MMTPETLEEQCRTRIQERETCADLAAEMGYEDVAQAIRARTCESSGHHFVKEDRRGNSIRSCGICGRSMLELVRGGAHVP